MEKLHEFIEILQPTHKGDEKAIAYDTKKQQPLKIVARLIDGFPIYLEEDYVIEKKHPAQKEIDHLKFKTNLNNI